MLSLQYKPQLVEPFKRPAVIGEYTVKITQKSQIALYLLLR